MEEQAGLEEFAPEPAPQETEVTQPGVALEAAPENSEVSFQEIGRERIERIGSFFSRMKEGFKDKVRRAGETVSAAAGRAKEIGISTLETAMAAPEIAKYGIETAVGAGVVAYEKSKETVIAAKDRVVEAKDAVVQRGKDAIESGVQAVADAKDATMEFGNHALYRAAERISRPFIEFQSRRLSSTLRYVAEQVDRGKASPEDLEKVSRLLNQLKGIEAI